MLRLTRLTQEQALVLGQTLRGFSSQPYDAVDDLQTLATRLLYSSVLSFWASIMPWDDGEHRHQCAPIWHGSGGIQGSSVTSRVKGSPLR